MVSDYISPSKSPLFMTQSVNLDVPKEILNSLLPPQSTPSEFMQVYSHYDTDQETESFTSMAGSTPTRMSNMVNIANPSSL